MATDRLLLLHSSVAYAVAWMVRSTSMKKMNPYYRKEWQKDRELGPTYAQRVEELELLE